jgi:hypothetical protein
MAKSRKRINNASRTKKIKKSDIIKDASSFKYVMEKKGFNEGGIFESPSGIRYLVKILDDEHIFNEILASKLYKLLHIPVPELCIGKNLLFENKRYDNVLMGKWIYGLQKFDNLNVPREGKAGYIYGAGADMWLSNRDVFGRDNLLRGRNNNLIRIDLGDSMFMRAQSWLGKRIFNNTNVPEIKTFIDPPSYKKSKGKSIKMSIAIKAYSEEELRDSLKRVATLSDNEIKTVVMSVYTSASEVLDLPDNLAEEYINVLLKRKHIIASYVSAMNDISSSSYTYEQHLNH